MRKRKIAVSQGIVSNPAYLVVWTKALYEGHAMKGDYLKRLLQSVEIGGHIGVRYGIVVVKRENGPLGNRYGHSGWIPGYCSCLRYYTEHRVADAFQINTDIGIVDGSTRIVVEKTGYCFTYGCMEQ